MSILSQPSSSLLKIKPPAPLAPLPPNSLLEQEFAPAYQGWKASPEDKTQTAAFLKAIDPLIVQSLRSYGGDSPTIRSRAKLMALDGAKRYNPAKAKLRSFMLHHMQGLRRENQKEQQIIRIPERVALEGYQVSQATRELADRLQREPSDQELADHMGLSTKRITYIRQAALPLAEGQFTSRSEDGGNELMTPAVLSDNPSGWLDFVYDDLSPTDQVVMDYSLGRNGRPKRTTSQIAAELGISPSAVSQRLSKIQTLLSKRYDTEIGL